MAVIIGNSTAVDTALFADGGIISVNFGFSPQVNRLWQLGSFVPYDTYVQRQRQISITGYGKKADGTGGSQVFDLTPSTSCADASNVQITVTLGVCEVSITPFQDYFFPTSYSYSKDNFGFGQESWSFVSKPIIDNYTGTIYMLRLLSTGSMLTGDGIMTGAGMGFVINDTSSRDSDGDYIEDSTGSVSAGQLSIGEYATTRDVVVSSVGGSEGKLDGYKGQCSCSIQHQPVYL